MNILAQQTDRKEIDLLEYWRIILKRRWILITFAAALVIFVAVISFTTTPLYKATATVLIDEPGSSMMNIQDILNYGGYYRTDYLGTYFNTQLRILTSRTLAERVAKKINFAARPEYRSGRASRPNPVRGLKSLLSFRWLSPKKTPASPPEAGAAPGTDYSGYAFTVQGGLSVAPIQDTRIVMVGFTAPNPALAADTVNTLVEEFVAYSVESRYEATKQTSNFLSDTIAQLREDLKRKEDDLQRYGKEKNLLFLNDKESSVLNNFTDVNNAYNDARIDRYNKESLYRELRGLDINALPESVNSATIQALKTSYLQARSDYDEKSKIYGAESAYPDMVRAKSRLESTKTALEDEIHKAVRAAEADYRAALNKEKNLQGLLEAQRTDVQTTNNNAVLYKSLETEVESIRNLLSQLLARQNEIQVSSQLGGLRTSNIKIVDKALVPRAPFTPNTRRNLMMALMMGLFGGVGLIFLVEFLDNTLKSPEEVEKLTGLPSLGIIPYLTPDGFKKRYEQYGRYDYSYGSEAEIKKETIPEVSEIELVNHLFPKFSIAEDYRTVRTSILFSHADGAPKTISFTSTLPQEGKTATVSNLAISFAQLEGKVLLIDADLRKPRLHKVFQIRNMAGLSGFLAGKTSFEEIIQMTTIENIWMIPSGPHPPNPAELLNSKRMRDLLTFVKERFDVILIDTPPVLPVIDPVIVSSLVDSTVFIVRAGKTTRRPLVKAVSEIRRSKAEIIGVVFNEVKIGRQSLGGTPYYHYYQYDNAPDGDGDRGGRRRVRVKGADAEGRPRDPGGQA